MNSTVQKWKIDDSNANRNGAHHTCYFVSKKGKSLKNTGEYSGSWLNNKKHGFGVQTTKSNKYEGGWLEGKKHGEGTQWVKRNGELKKQYFGGFIGGKRDVSAFCWRFMSLCNTGVATGPRHVFLREWR